MPTARINRPTRTNRPTRNSDQVNCLRCAMRTLVRACVPAYTTEPRRRWPILLMLRRRREFRHFLTPKRESTCTLYRNCGKFLSDTNHSFAVAPKLDQKPLQVRIIRRQKFLGTSLKIDSTVAQNEKARHGGTGLFLRGMPA